MERLDFDLLFRWFVGLGVDDPVWNHSTFSKNRDRLLAGDIAAEFLAQVLDQPRVRRLLSSEHFSVDGSLVEAWASMKSFRPKDDPGDPPTGGRNGSRDFHGERRANDSHASTTDPDARLYRKGPGQEAKLCFVGHVLMENRHGLVVDAELMITIGAYGQVEVTFGAMQGGLELEYSRSTVFFTSAEFEEMGRRSAAPDRPRLPRRRLARDRVRLPPRRRGDPESRSSAFFRSGNGLAAGRREAALLDGERAGGVTMTYFAGLDVGLEETAIRIIDLERFPVRWNIAGVGEVVGAFCR